MDARQAARQIFQAALESADPIQAVKRALHRQGDSFEAGGQHYALKKIHRVLVVGFGKAGASMARGAEEVLGDWIGAGQVTVKYGHTAPLAITRLYEAGHPLVDENSLEGTRRLLGLLNQATEHDLVLCLVSGGGSALLELPAEGILLADLQAANTLLLRSGASISELNTIRKHLSQVKGGQLARHANGAPILSLILSDVIGSPLDMIASGPTVPDPTTFADCLAVIERYHLSTRLPASILSHLQAGAAGAGPETPKPGNPLFEHVQNLVIADGRIACQAAMQKAAALGYHPLLLTTSLQGEAREAGRFLAAVAREVRQTGQPVTPPACLVLGGEPVVTVIGSGKGGRAMELTLSAAIELAGLDGVTIFSAGTDGSDGPTNAAGAIADGATIARAQALGFSPIGCLDNNDSYPYFAALEDLVVTGPTNTNVNDITLALVD